MLKPLYSLVLFSNCRLGLIEIGKDHQCFQNVSYYLSTIIYLEVHSENIECNIPTELCASCLGGLCIVNYIPRTPL
jgi:hypothetical protein